VKKKKQGEKKMKNKVAWMINLSEKFINDLIDRIK